MNELKRLQKKGMLCTSTEGRCFNSIETTVADRITKSHDLQSPANVLFSTRPCEAPLSRSRLGISFTFSSIKVPAYVGIAQQRHSVLDQSELLRRNPVRRRRPVPFRN